MTDNNNFDEEKALEVIKKTVGSYPDFPKKGILFRLVGFSHLSRSTFLQSAFFVTYWVICNFCFSDFFPIFRHPQVFADLVQLLLKHIRTNHSDVEAIIGLESRGFLIAPILSLNLKIPFIPIRKSGKLPGVVARETYALEYGNDAFEIQTEAITKDMKCILFDDLLATGGSLNASVKLVSKCGGNVVKCIVVMELVDLEGRKKLNVPVYSMIQY